MSAKISTLFKDSSIKYSLLLSFFFLIIQIILLVFFYAKLPPLIPFFNSLPWGQERLGKLELVFLVPAGTLLILILNTYIAKRIYIKHGLTSRLLSVNGLLISLLGFVALAQIMLLVF